MNRDEFIEQFIYTHGDKYEYGSEIINYKIDIHCKTCLNDFSQNIYKHRNGKNCPICVGGIKSNREDFIKKSIIKNGNNCDYSLVEYINSKSKVKLICKIHDCIFEQVPNDHLNGGVIIGCKGCPKCSNNKRFTNDEFINISKNIYNEKYNYSNLNYVNNNTPVELTCNIHNYTFKQTPTNHLIKEGCNKCKKYPVYDTELFKFKSTLKHDGRYSYEKSIFINRLNEVIVTCHSHGDFSIKPFEHIRGTRCPKCTASIGEYTIMNLLDSFKIEYLYDTKMKGCFDKNHLLFDFYLPSYNTIIEFDGKQHFESIKNWGGIDKLNDVTRKDNIKNKYCEDNNIKLIRIPYWDFDNIEYIIRKELVI